MCENLTDLTSARYYKEIPLLEFTVLKGHNFQENNRKQQ